MDDERDASFNSPLHSSVRSPTLELTPGAAIDCALERLGRGEACPDASGCRAVSVLSLCMLECFWLPVVVEIG